MNNREIYEALDILAQDGKATANDIALMLGLSERYVEEMITKLENERIIVKYSAIINTDKLEKDLTESLIEVKVDPQRERGYDEIAGKIMRFPEVKSVYLMSGTYDLAVLLTASTVKQISKFVFEKLAVIEGVRSTSTHFIMRKYKESGVVLCDEESDNRLVVSP